MLNSPLRCALKPLLTAMRAGNSTTSVPSFYFNFSNPQNVTLGAAQARGNITSTQNAVIAASVSPSRTTGVAPLYVNFDATGTTSTLSTNPSHELFFAHDFGDAGAGTWANGVQSSGLTSKNAGYGPVTGHVYETPGTYTVQMVVTDGVNTAVKTGTIVVQDPNTVYAGTNTICISHSNNFTGAPSGATQVNTAGNTDMYAAFNTYKGNNKRILFCKSDAWTCSAPLAITNFTGLFLGGYGTGVAATFGAGTMVSVTPSALNSSVFNITSGVTDLRVCNFKIAADSTTKAVGINNSILQALFYKVEVRGCSAGFSAPVGSGGTNNVMDQHCMYECLVSDLYGYSGVDTPRANVTTTNGVANIAATAHPYVVGYQVHFPTGPEGTAQFPSTGTFPTPFAVSTGYFISADSFASNTFRLAPTRADALAGTNTITPTASGTYPLFANGISGGIGAFVAFVRGGMLGCYLDSCNHGEQTLRTPYLSRAHINNNYIARPNQGKNIVKIHSFDYGEVALYSEKFVFSANVLDMQSGYSYGAATLDPASVVTTTEVGDTAILIGNGGVSGNERVRNCIVENNYTYGCRAQPKTPTFGSFQCPNLTARNNIADFRLGSTGAVFNGTYISRGAVFCYVGSSTADYTTSMYIYNNTMYCNIDDGTCYMVGITGANTSGIVIKNNIGYQPYIGYWADKPIYVSGGATVAAYTASNNTVNQNTDPGFVNTPPVALTDWRTTAAWTIDNGATVPVLRDFNNASRVGGTYDLGAVLP